MANITMNAKDAISAKLAECYVTIENRRYLLMQGKAFEAKFDKTKKELNILGRTGSGNKSNGWKGTGKITIYKNTSIFDELMERYKNTGEDVYFDIQVTMMIQHLQQAFAQWYLWDAMLWWSVSIF